LTWEVIFIQVIPTEESTLLVRNRKMDSYKAFGD